MSIIDLRYAKLGTREELNAANIVLAFMQPGIEKDTGCTKLGDGRHKYTELEYFTGVTTRTYRGRVASMAEMTALKANVSDWVNRTDEGDRIYELTALPAADPANWTSYIVGATSSNDGPTSAEVNQLIDQRIAIYNTTVQPKIDQAVSAAVATNIDGRDFTTVQASQTYVRGLITGTTPVPSAPVPNVAPSVAFPGGTGDVGETATITPGTYSSGTVTATSWNVIVNGVIVLNTVLPSFVIPAAAGTGARSVQVTELYSWSGGAGQTGKSSAVYTINAPAAVPATSSTLGPIVVASNTATCPHALWTNTPTGYVQTCYDALGTVLGTASGNTSASLLSIDTTTLGGRQIRWGEIASNGAGSAVAEIFSAFATIAGGSTPTYAGGVEPGFVAATFAVGTPLVIDFGVALNSPQGYDVQIYRNGVAATNTGTFATNVPSFSYTPISLDSDQIISATVVPRNAANVGPAVLIAGVAISPAVGGGGGGGGGGGTISYVGVSALGSTSATAAVSPPLPAGVQTADFVLAPCSINVAAYSFGTPGGWTANGANSSIATPEGLSVNAFYKALGASESTPTFTATGSDYKQGTLIAYRGATRVVATAVTTNNASNASGFTITWPSVTTDAANQIVTLVADLDPSGGTVAPVTLSNLPAGSTVRSNVGAEDGNCLQQIIIEVPVAAIGATGTFTCTVTTDAPATGWIARTTAIGV